MNRNYIALAYGEINNVIVSQFLNYFLHLREKNIIFDLNFLLSGKDFFEYVKGNFPYRDLLNEYGHKNWHCTFAPFLNLQFSRNVTKLIFKSRIVKDRDFIHVAHCRGLAAAQFFTPIKQTGKNVRMIVDIRGDKPSETAFLLRQAGYKEDEIAKRIKAVCAVEKHVIKNSDHIFCISHKMKENLLARNSVRADRITVIPCCAESKFKYESRIRKEFRKNYKLEDKKVLIYSGGLSAWHNSEQVFKIMGKLSIINSEIFPVILTPDLERGQQLSEKFLLPGKFILKSVKNKDVPQYLMGSDYAIILRKKDKLNKVASPTKIAEYIMAGLPVIISEDIGDYSDFILSNKIGAVVDTDKKYESITSEINQFIKEYTIDKEKISNLGIENFSKEKYIDQMAQIYMMI